jgi:hypothetical protein
MDLSGVGMMQWPSYLNTALVNCGLWWTGPRPPSWNPQTLFVHHSWSFFCLILHYMAYTLETALLNNLYQLFCEVIEAYIFPWRVAYIVSHPAVSSVNFFLFVSFFAAFAPNILAVSLCRTWTCLWPLRGSSSSFRIRPSGLFPPQLIQHYGSLQTFGRTPWTVDQPFLKAATYTGQHKRGKTSMPGVGFEPTITVFQRAKTFHVLDRADAVIGFRLLLILYAGYWLYGGVGFPDGGGTLVHRFQSDSSSTHFLSSGYRTLSSPWL